jgi:hypothetical protein
MTYLYTIYKKLTLKLKSVRMEEDIQQTVNNREMEWVYYCQKNRL